MSQLLDSYLIISFAFHFQMEKDKSTSFKGKIEKEISIEEKVKPASAAANIHVDDILDDTDADLRGIELSKLYFI